MLMDLPVGIGIQNGGASKIPRPPWERSHRLVASHPGAGLPGVLEAFAFFSSAFEALEAVCGFTAVSEREKFQREALL